MTSLLLVGCGKIATAAHLPALRDLQQEGMVEVLVSDLDPDRARAAAERFGLRAAGGWREAARSVDAVSVCLPPGLNAQVAAEAASLGRHVICEKPPGRDLGQARDLAGAAAAHPDRVTVVAFNRRFNPLYLEAMARSTSLGPPTSFYGRVSGALLGKPPSDSVDDWISSAGSHALDLAVATMGFPLSVSVDRRQVGGGPDNAWTIQLHCPAGSALLLLHFAAGRRTERYEWLGPTYDVRLDLPKDGDFAHGGEIRTLSQSGEFHLVSGFTGEYRAFLSAIAGGARPACDFEYGARFMSLVGTILTAAPGTLTPVAVDARPVGTDAVGSEAAVSSHAATDGRPVVVLHHPVAMHPRFFRPERLSALHQRADVRVLTGDDPGATLREATAIVTGRGAKSLTDHLQDAPELGLVVVIGASVRGIDPEKLLERGVVVCNTADAVAQSVAEHCLMVTLAGLRRLSVIDRGMRAGGWPRPGRPPDSVGARFHPRRLARKLPLSKPVRTRLGQLERRLRAQIGGVAGSGRSGGATARGAPKAVPYAGSPGADLRGQVVGLVGWSHTARHFAELLRPFDCQVLVASDAAATAELEAVGARRAAIGELLGSARVVSLHRGLSDHTRGSFDAGVLEQLRPGTVLVNTARGELVDEDALVARLRRGDIVAALDVYATEPLPAKHPLRSLTNVILTPHNASTTEQEEQRMGDEAITTVVDWLDGRPVRGLTADRLARMT